MKRDGKSEFDTICRGFSRSLDAKVKFEEELQKFGKLPLSLFIISVVPEKDYNKALQILNVLEMCIAQDKQGG